MANRKKAKEEKTPKSKIEEVASNIEEKNGEDSQVSVPTIEDFENSEKLKEATDSLVEELKDAAELEELSHSHSDHEEISEEVEQVTDPEPEDTKPKLHILAGERLNSVINEANELGITDVVQIINSDKFGQFYLIYRE